VEVYRVPIKRLDIFTSDIVFIVFA
jgi:hypothetical protein